MNQETYAFSENFGRFIETRINLGEELADDSQFREILPPYVGEGAKRFDGSPFGDLRIGKEIATTMTGSIQDATVVNSDGNAEIPRRVAVKYYNDCYERFKNVQDKELWIVNSYRYLRLFNETGIVPRVYFLSGESELPPMFHAAAPFVGHFAVRNYDRCVQLGAKVSYMVQDLVGPSVATYIVWLNRRMGKHTDFTKTVLVLAKKAVELLDVVYRYGVVHGDINFRNIAFKHPVESFETIVPETSGLVLLDFKFGDFYPSNINKPYAESLNVQWKATAALSLWELSGYRRGPRDDALIGDDICASDRAKAQETLEKIADHVKAAVTPDEEPDYSGIADAIDRVIRHITTAKRV